MMLPLSPFSPFTSFSHLISSYGCHPCLLNLFVAILAQGEFDHVQLNLSVTNLAQGHFGLNISVAMLAQHIRSNVGSDTHHLSPKH